MIPEFVSTASAIAREAGVILRERYGEPHDIRHKGLVDLVTEADAASEQLIAARLRAAFPDHDLLGEEGARGAGSDAPFRWVVDPLDGTTNFAHSFPHFAVSIGLEEQGEPILGVVYDPLRDELFVGGRDLPATLNDVPIAVSSTPALISAVLATGFSYDLAQRQFQAPAWRSFLLQVQSLRQTGSAALNLCYVACGRLDGYWERHISPWDVVAGVAILRAAGGMASNFADGPFASAEREVVGSNRLIHAEMIAVISGAASWPGSA